MAERFLGARSGDADKALRLLSECAQAKTKYRVPYLKTLTPEEILGVDEHVFTHFYPHGQRGHDRLHRPIVFEDSGGINIGAVLHMTTLERLRDLHLYSMEVSVDRLLSQYHSSFGNASGTADSTESAAKIVAVSDLSRVTLSHVSARLLEHLKGLAQIDNMCYPEVLGNMFLVNAPHIAVVAYKVIKAFIDKKTQRKIEALGPGQSATRLLQVSDPPTLSYPTLPLSFPTLSDPSLPYPTLSFPSLTAAAGHRRGRVASLSRWFWRGAVLYQAAHRLREHRCQMQVHLRALRSCGLLTNGGLVHPRFAYASICCRRTRRD